MIVYKSCPNCGNKNIIPVLSAKDYTVSGDHFEIWECKDCSFRFTQNIPDKDKIGKFYQSENYISHTDTAKGFINNLYHKVRKRTLVQKRKLVEKVTGMSRGNILDMGCGTGAFLDTMKNSQWDTTGLEPDKTARDKALELYGLNLDTPGIFYSLPEKTFDAITLWHVLEHVHDLHDYIGQLKKLLTHGGKLFIAVPNYTSYDAEIYKEFWAAYDVPRHLYHFSPGSMKILLNQHGLKLEMMKPMWFDSVYVSMLSEQYKTGKSHPVKALFSGLVSNIQTLMDKEKCSSIIYVASA
ncbi:MAG: methyltransferase domain-containing protein [Bacteroidota bacterium]|nr:methyltransferase domain-containing protein [Bacteroidota bacterium]